MRFLRAFICAILLSLFVIMIIQINPKEVYIGNVFASWDVKGEAEAGITIPLGMVQQVSYSSLEDVEAELSIIDVGKDKIIYEDTIGTSGTFSLNFPHAGPYVFHFKKISGEGIYTINIKPQKAGFSRETWNFLFVSLSILLLILLFIYKR